MQEEFFVDTIRRSGGRVFIVGGWVRDWLRQAVPKDKDFVISGLSEEKFCQLFPDAQKAGKAFPVYLLKIDGNSSEVALARRERKTSCGYTGFQVEYDPYVTIEEDLKRRDTTMNSIAMELPMKTLIDPFHGAADIFARCIRATSVHFVEDPVRALRAARQASELGFRLLPETFRSMAACSSELAAEPQERILQELTRALASKRPSVFFRALRQADLLSVVFPEIQALIGQIQPIDFHPEGDAFEHTMQILDQVSLHTQGIAARFAALVHDIGKGTTPADMLPHHYGHEQRGVQELMRWNQRCTLPKLWLRSGLFIITEHMRAPRLKKAGKIVALLLAVHHSVLSLSDFCCIIRADYREKLPEYLTNGEYYLSAFLGISGHDAPRELHGEAVGQWVFNEQAQVYMRMIRNQH